MRYFIIAGEASGDLHGSNLMRELKIADPEAQFCFLGGDLMAQIGGKPLIHYRQMAFMGIVSVVLHLRTILRNMTVCKNALRQFAPDVLILIDYPGFNLRIAKYAKETLGLKVFYYISPKLWAWKEYRIKHIKRLIDSMFCIFPFEIEFYKKHNYLQTSYVGNPLLDSIETRPNKDEIFSSFTLRNKLADKPIVALLAGSRKKEITDNLPKMLSLIPHFTEYQFVVAGAPGIDPSFYSSFLVSSEANVVYGQTYPLLQQAAAAIVTSGTATLETALLNVPQVVTYSVQFGRIVQFLYKLLIHTPFFSLVNIIAGKAVIVELLGAQVTTPALRDELEHLLHDSTYRKAMLHEYSQIREQLGTAGASAKAAKAIIAKLKEQIA